MTGQEFLRWLEKCSIDPLCKSSLGEQVGLMRAEIMDANADRCKTAIENLTELKLQLFDSVPASSGIKRLLEEVRTGRGAASVSRANSQCTQTLHRRRKSAKRTS